MASPSAYLQPVTGRLRPSADQVATWARLLVSPSLCVCNVSRLAPTSNDRNVRFIVYTQLYVHEKQRPTNTTRQRSPSLLSFPTAAARSRDTTGPFRQFHCAASSCSSQHDSLYIDRLQTSRFRVDDFGFTLGRIRKITWWTQSGLLMKNVYHFISEQHEDMKSGVSRFKNATILQARCGS